MPSRNVRATVALLLGCSIGLAVAADDGPRPARGAASPSFQRVSTLANFNNNSPEQFRETTVSEIVAATQDGMTLVYTDSELGQVGFVDIRDPASPVPTGTLDVGGEPTSVDVYGNRYALVAVNTSESFVKPGGKLVVIDVATRGVVRQIDLGGQPDSLKISPDRRYAAIAIENERDEDVGEGELPQLPAGYLAIIDLPGSDPAAWSRRDVALTGLAAYAPQDPEPEFVDINPRNQAVVTLQENNHIVIVDLRTGSVLRHFPAGTVSLSDVDATEDDRISLSESLADVPREPDAVAWLPGPLGDFGVLATANEGDLFGGSRGFTVFSRFGPRLFDSGNGLERLAVRHGHYPESRSENKGTEPEAVEYGRFGRDDYLFVNSERGSFVAVYELKFGFYPVFRQLLPAPFGPEGLLAIPSRNLLVVSGEEDDPPLGVRSTLSIYQLKRGEPAYPQILSANDAGGKPIAWSALSGMVALPGSRSRMLAVWDSYYSESRIFTIDAADSPARIVDFATLRGGRGNYDPEGIAIAPDGTYWIASEGNATDTRPNLLVQSDARGNVLQEVGLPAAILACRKASTRRGTLGSGFEGLAVLPGARGSGGYRLLVAQQRGWDYTTPECEALDDDAGGFNAVNEPNRSRLWIYDTATQAWDHVAWELAPKPADAAWVGLSEITAAPDGSYVVLERDNRTGTIAELKTLVRIEPRAWQDGLVTSAEKSVHDFKPRLEATNGWITDKPEGVAILDDGRAFVVTDNDGVEDWSGETWFLELGPFRRLFR
ncbi:MAG: esterase-like activity of phytase family protein [Steroidobacteraceae bacterium]|jgi:DNA-binding beta-propeller fold protein YncE|nr:esterase-like activity of phytase family protein [Steroidobacteraceae bacterium]